MECKVISNDREALFLSTQFEFFRDSSHASRGKRNSIVPSITEIEIQKSGMKTKIEHTHLSPLFLFLYNSFSIPLSLFLSFSLSLFLYISISLSLFGVARGKRIIQLVPSIEIGLSSIPLHPNPTRYTLPSLCVSIFHALYTSNLFPLSRKHSALSIRRAD